MYQHGVEAAFLELLAYSDISREERSMKRFGNAVWITLRAVSLYSCSGERMLKMNPNTQFLKAIENEGILEEMPSFDKKGWSFTCLMFLIPA